MTKSFDELTDDEKAYYAQDALNTLKTIMALAEKGQPKETLCFIRAQLQLLHPMIPEVEKAFCDAEERLDQLIEDSARKERIGESR